jgi:hypothetical protein
MLIKMNKSYGTVHTVRIVETAPFYDAQVMVVVLVDLSTLCCAVLPVRWMDRWTGLFMYVAPVRRDQPPHTRENLNRFADYTKIK